MDTASPSPGRQPAAAGAPRQQRLFLRFTLAADRYVLDANDIAQVLPLMRLKKLPNAPSWVAGIMQYRGAPVPVIDMPALATGVAARVLASTRIVLAHYRPTAQAQARMLGLILENASETVHYDVAQFTEYGLDNRQAPYLGPVRSSPQGLEQWVHVPGLLPAEVRARLFPGASSGDAP